MTSIFRQRELEHKMNRRWMLCLDSAPALGLTSEKNAQMHVPNWCAAKPWRQSLNMSLRVCTISRDPPPRLPQFSWNLVAATDRVMDVGLRLMLYVCKLNPEYKKKPRYEDCKRAGLCLIQKTFKSPADLYKWLRESAESFLPHLPLLTRPSQKEPSSISLTYYPLTFCLQSCSATSFVFRAAEGSDIINQLTLTENVKSQHGSLCRWSRTKTLVYSLNGRDDGRGAYVAVSLFA